MKDIRLHIGCGNRILEGWVNIDKSSSLDLPIEVYAGDITDLNEIVGPSGVEIIPDGSVELIYASHVLDHLSRKEELDRALSECYRVLKPEGILRVSVSDFERVATMYNEGMDLEKLWGHIVGGHKTEHDKHGCVFDYNVLKRYLEKHGFKDIKKYDYKKFLPKEFDDLSQCYIPHLDKKNGILMALNVEAKK